MMLVHLRQTQESDLDFVLAAEQAAENCSFIGQWTWEEHRAALTDPDHHHCIVERLADHVCVGYLIFQGLASPHQTILIRRLVITEKSNGYGRQSLQLAKKLAFEVFGAHRLWLDVKTFNNRAQALYQSEGFVVEGTMRDCVKVGDRFESLKLMSILRHEYEQRLTR